MRRLALFTAAVLAALAVAVPASASAGHAAMIARDHARVSALAHARACNEVYDWERGTTGSAEWAQADWEANSCSHLLQVRVHCAQRIGYATRYSGQVKAVELNARATCPSLEAVTQAAIRFSNNGGSTWTPYQQLWP